MSTKKYEVDENTAAICGLFCSDCGEVIFWYDRGSHKCKTK